MSGISLFDRVLAVAASYSTQRAFARLEQVSAAARATQDAVLSAYIARHGESDFGKAHRLAEARDYAGFTQRIPIAGYEAFAPYIERVKRGEFRALLGPRQRVLMFAMTSGTTAEPKYIPVTREFLKNYQRGWNQWGVKAIIDHPGTFLRKIVQVTSPMRDQVTEAGIPCGAITGLLAASQKLLVRRFYVSPLAVADIKDAAAKYYTIMRLAVPEDVAFLVTANPATLLQLARVADTEKETLIRDIHDGGLSERINVPHEVRRALASRLTASPDVARRLERLVAEHGALRPRDYWKTGFLAHWTGGTMGLYRQFFAEWYGDVPVRDIGLLASEGRVSTPIEDGTSSGVLDAASQFYEFIPAEEYGTQKPTVLRSHELEVEQEYFLLLTNASGLCRYDIGDRIRVTGWYGEAPLIEFLSKGAHTASLAGEKLTEDQVIAAAAEMNRDGPVQMHQFVLAPQFAQMPFYRLYLDADLLDSDARARVCELGPAFDQALCRISIEYASKRETDRLGMVQVVCLPKGWLARRNAERRAQSSSRAEQFKHQYLLPQPGADADWPHPDACVRPD